MINSLTPPLLRDEPKKYEKCKGVKDKNKARSNEFSFNSPEHLKIAQNDLYMSLGYLETC